MNVNAIFTRIGRAVVVTAVAAGLFAGVAALPAQAAAAAPAAAAVAAAQPTVRYSVQCSPGRADWKLTVQTSTPGQTYAYLGGAYYYTAQGWVSTVGSRFEYGTTIGPNTVQLGGVRQTALTSGVYWAFFVYVWVWQGNGWSGPVLVHADHDGGTGRYGQPYCHT